MGSVELPELIEASGGVGTQFYQEQIGFVVVHRLLQRGGNRQGVDGARQKLTQRVFEVASL